MDMMSALQQAGGIDAVSRELGIDSSTAQAGVGALLPAILAGVGAQAENHPAGLGGLGAILGSLGGGALLSNVLGAEPTNVDQGNNVLGQIFGSKDGSRAVAADAAQKSGLSSDLLKKMLPIVAMLVAGYLAKNATDPTSAGAGEGGTAPSQEGGLLGSLLGAATGGGGGGLLGSILGGLTRR
ncbi:MAG: DUF937 domain-containing protein [Sphingomicrobium sp.]